MVPAHPAKHLYMVSVPQWLLLPITPCKHPRIFPKIFDTQSKIGYGVCTPCKISWDILYPVPSNLGTPCKIPMGMSANTNLKAKVASTI